MPDPFEFPTAVVAGYLEELRQRFEAGDRAAVLSAVRFCGTARTAMPEWVVAAFFAATNRWYSMEAKTLDEAFGVEWPKGKQRGAARHKRRLQPAVFNAVRERLQRSPETPIDGLLFEEVGAEFGIGKTQAAELYYEAKSIFSSSPAFDAFLEPYKARPPEE